VALAFEDLATAGPGDVGANLDHAGCSHGRNV
jgi:hypothetical protein